MKNNSRKSRAFIITFILVLLLLIGGYYAFSNRAKLFGTNGKLSATRIFSPLFGTSGKINSEPNTSNNNEVLPDGNNTGEGSGTGTSGSVTSGSGSGSGSGASGSGSWSGTDSSGSGASGSGSGLKPTNFEFKPVPSPLAYNPDPYNPDTYNPGDYNPDTYNPIDYNRNPYNPDTYNTKDYTGEKTVIPTENECPIDPLENYLTKEEKEKLASLTAEFYDLAYTLRTPDDILLIQKDIKQIEKDIDEAKQLTAECNQQKSDSRYTGPKTIYGNPYYAKETRYDFDPSLGGAFPEINNFNITKASDFAKFMGYDGKWIPRIHEKHLFVYKNSYLKENKSEWLENIVSSFLGKPTLGEAIRNPFSVSGEELQDIVLNFSASEQEKEEGVAYVRNIIRQISGGVIKLDDEQKGPIGRDGKAEGYFLPNNYSIFEAMFDIW